MKIIFYLLFLNYIYALGCQDCFYNGIKYDAYSNIGLCKNDYFYVSYSKEMLNPDYTAFLLTYKHMKLLKGGRKSFILDKELEEMNITQPKPNSKAYNTTYNKGHLTPSYAMSWNKNDDGPWYNTYLMSNIAPQYYKLNQISWNKLENNEVNFILNNKIDLFVIIGVSYNNRNKPLRTFDNIAIPDYFYNVICDPINVQSVGFISHNNEKYEYELKFNKVSDIETKIGLNLFKNCNNNQLNISHWW